MKRFFLLLTICCWVVCFGSPVKSMLGADGTEMSEVDEFINPYITDGLVAMWDGEWNAGFGIHDSTSITWTDCIGGITLQRYRPQLSNAGWWLEKCYYNPAKDKNTNGDSFFINEIPSYMADVFSTAELTIEVCFKSLDNYYNNVTFFYVYPGNHLVTDSIVTLWASNYSIRGNGWTLSRGQVKWTKGDFTTLSVLGYGIGQEVIAYNNSSGTSQTKSMFAVNVDEIVPSNTRLRLMSLWQSDNDTFQGEFYCLRIYNRPLTEEEMLHNYSVDKLRFE